MISRYKKHRALNINLNIIFSSVLATLLALYPVYMTKMLTHSPVIIVLISFFIDAIIDFGIFSVLHISIHRHHVKRFRPSRILVGDLFNIQIQRIILSVLYFVVAVSLHYFLIMEGLGRASSFLIAYLTALVVTRTVHTAYGLKTGLFKPL